MLSQTAWKIGRAFTQGRSGALSEFAAVEREANGLSEALKLTAETLHADGSLLSKADRETKNAVIAILESAARTLGDLESLIERYQVIRKRGTNGGFVVERSWSEVIMANYKTIKWTTEGGDIKELRNMLQMHANTINLTMQALQTRSLSRLEKTVVPMAENIKSIHEHVNGDLSDKINDLHRVIMSVADSTPSLAARDRSVGSSASEDLERQNMLLTLDYETDDDNEDHAQHNTETLSPHSISTSSKEPERRLYDSARSTPAFQLPKQFSPNSEHQAMDSLSDEQDTMRIDWDFELGRLIKLSGDIENEGDSPHVSSAKSTHFSVKGMSTSSRRKSDLPRRASSTLPDLLEKLEEKDVTAGSSRDTASRYQRNLSYDSSISPADRLTARLASKGRQMLPPPAMPLHLAEQQQSPATPSSIFGRAGRSWSESNTSQQLTRPQTANSVNAENHSSRALQSLQAFEKSLFRNAAILCDVRSTLVEYAQHVQDEPDPRFNTEMVAACQDCRICVIRKYENRAHGGTRLATSIWAISEDATVKCQLKLSELVETVPYCSYFEKEKVSIAPTEDEIILRFHGERWTDVLEKEIKTNWVNYKFASENDAIAFESAVFGRNLIGSFRTLKTTVIHEGIMGTFAFEEQFSNIETLRLWEEDGVAMQGAQGGVLALMHVSSNFGEGWARWVRN